jgi:hypothetical protein
MQILNHLSLFFCNIALVFLFPSARRLRMGLAWHPGWKELPADPYTGAFYLIVLF